MITPDYTKKDFIPNCISVEKTPKHLLKTGDDVIILGERFRVEYNFFDELSCHYKIKMNHLIDKETFIKEYYAIEPIYLNRVVK